MWIGTCWRSAAGRSRRSKLCSSGNLYAAHGRDWRGQVDVATRSRVRSDDVRQCRRIPPRCRRAATARRELDRAAASISRSVSQYATRIELCLFDASGRDRDRAPDLPARTGDIWHGFLPARFGGPGCCTAIASHGPYEPAHGHRFNPAKLLVDPCASALHGELTWHPSLQRRRARVTTVGRGRDDSAPLRAASAASSTVVRLGRRALAQRPVARHDHLRAARQGIHAASPGGVRARCAASISGSRSRRSSTT